MELAVDAGLNGRHASPVMVALGALNWRRIFQVLLGTELNSDYLSIQAFGSVLVLTTHVFLLIHLLRRGFMSRHASRADKIFSTAIALSAFWGLTALLGAEMRSTSLMRVAATADLLRYGAWLSFLLAVLYSSQVSSWHRRPVALAAVVVLGFSLCVLALDSLVPRGLGHAVVTSFLALPIFGLMLLEQVFRNQTQESTWNIKPICVGLAFGFASDVYIFSEAVMFGSPDRDAFEVRGIIHSLSTPLLFVASQRHRSWAQRIQLSRNAVFYSATLLLIGSYLLFVAGAGYYVRYFGGSWGRAIQLALVAAAILALVVVVMSASIRARIRVLLSKNLFRYRFDYREEWLQFTGMLSMPTEPTEVGGLVIRGLSNMVECPAGALWTRELGGSDFVQTARWNLAASEAKEAADSPLSRLLLAREWIVDIEEFRLHPDKYGDLTLPRWLVVYPSAWLVIPLLVGGKMIGFAVLSKPRTAVDLNWEVRDLLKTAARQAAVFLSQMYATEALLEARKFDAFNRMSAFVVHDLKNIITQLSLMLKNAQRHADNPEFQRDMLLTVESSLDKMRQMLAQLREGQKPVGSMSGVDLPALLQRIRATAEARGRHVDLEIVDTAFTRGDEQRLERVVGHVVQNALDATPESGEVSIRLDRDAGRARIVVTDSGVGMPQEFIRTQLFRPFNSTKENGMGIGSYESHLYISELGGSLSAESRVGKGTQITILLPLLQVRTQSDLTSPGRLGE